MYRIEFSPEALAQLDRMIEPYSLPSDTRGRVARCVSQIADFPSSGAQLSGEWDGFGFVLGPWSWMLIIYALVNNDFVGVAAIEDTRSGGAATSIR